MLAKTDVLSICMTPSHVITFILFTMIYKGRDKTGLKHFDSGVWERGVKNSRDDQSYFKIVAKPQTLASSFITIFPQTIIRNVEWLFCRLFGKCKKSQHEVMSEFWLHMYLFNDLLEKTGNAYVLNAWICWTMWTWVLTEEVLKTFQFSFAALKRFQMNTISPCDLV